MDRNIAAIIQARMASTRLPGKALMDISGKPMLWHVIKRLEQSNLLRQVIVATSINKKDDAIEDFCKQQGVAFYRGSELDVLDRYYQAAKSYNTDLIVRITSDCPFIDSEVMDKAIIYLLENSNLFDLATNTIKRTYPIGLDVEVFSFSVLNICNKKAVKAYQREHVTTYIYENPDLFRVYSLENEEDLSSLRWTVDEAADLSFTREIYNRLYPKKNFFFMRDIIRVLDEEPELIKINKDIKQKSLK